LNGLVIAALALALLPLRSRSDATIVVCTGLAYTAAIGLIVWRVRPSPGFEMVGWVGGRSHAASERAVRRQIVGVT